MKRNVREEAIIQVRHYLAPLMAIFFVLSGIYVDGYLGVVDYIVCYLLFLLFALPILLERSASEILVDFLPRFARDWAAEFRQKRGPKGPYDSKRVSIAMIFIMVLWTATTIPAVEVLSEAVSLSKEEVNAKGAVDRLLTQSAVLISISIFSILFVPNLLKRNYMGWYLKNVNKLSKELPMCWHVVNIFALIVLSFALSMSSYLGQFISGNYGFGVMLGIQLFIMLLFVPGERFLRGNEQNS